MSAMASDSDSDASSASAASSEASGPVRRPPAGSVASSAVVGKLRICFTSRKPRKCVLCNAQSTDESPLEYTDDIFPESQGRIPWRSYEKVRATDGESVRVPSGKLCLICFNVYRALGAVASISLCDFSCLVLF